MCNIIDGVIVDNNLFSNIIFDMIDLRNAEVTSEIWEKIFVISIEQAKPVKPKRNSLI
ncbi:hypothetical protein wVul_0020 [Wolbachia endosymbiont of Armadillidium vulgare str. wVulC]|uniref:Uncharacterized protein n=1 Tax=Wolbachia endosymbiont of Armadillidium arcangelii TaxID=3158571 RepID=A0AAU7Q5Z5_9RICK|nr:hypothetical protein wVul_0020 [Wolbachia endosymbiont of Armadillidium vulgare str. wVulC]OJH31704.1 hypothetical protein Wxf_01100 [Wolbachia endosymbiont of Armadillidium vulgare]OJH32670.1 hypothetical protein Wxf_02114 [Wolbachia endosymbiont of Armadillidium vulgare]OJH33292.1 hypothetical protein Wxf_02768 [Wolbachia endosymbiont of Armadillidium vulgare]